MCRLVLLTIAMIALLALPALCQQPCGDCNGDGVANIVDSLTAAQHSTGRITLSGVSFRVCDVHPANGDGIISALDAFLIAQASAEIATLSCVMPLPDGFTGMLHPARRGGFSMAYDSWRQRVVLFGGWGNGVHFGAEHLADTYDWDGAKWERRFPAHSPPGRWGAGMVFDSVRGKTVLFGGNCEDGLNPGEGCQYLNDTWEWDGTDWRQVFPIQSPPAWPHFADMEYDPIGQRGLILSISSHSAYSYSFWAYDGATWSETPTVGLPGFFPGRLASAYDWRRRVFVMLHTLGTTSGFSETWEWDGAVWRQMATPPTSPSKSYFPSMTYDSARGVSVCLAGVDYSLVFSSPANETWEWDGQTWVQRMSATTYGGYRDTTHLLFDSVRNRTMVWGFEVGIGSDSRRFREWDGVTWTQSPIPQQPTAGMNHALVFDATRGKTILYGGVTMVDSYDGWNPFDETWQWDGVQWQQLLPMNRPPPLRSTMMAHDDARGVSVLFGGSFYSIGPDSDQTWEWDGADWTQKYPSTSPSPRHDSGMVYHAADQVVLLFGGFAPSFTPGTVMLGDTWQWNGLEWEQRFPTSSPVSRGKPVMVYDPSRSRTVLFGGGLYTTSAEPIGALWEWNGNDWNLRGTLPGTQIWERAEGYQLFVYDPRHGGVLSLVNQHEVPYLWDGSEWSFPTIRNMITYTSSYPNQMVYDSWRNVCVYYGWDILSWWTTGTMEY